VHKFNSRVISRSKMDEIDEDELSVCVYSTTEHNRENRHRRHKAS